MKDSANPSPVKSYLPTEQDAVMNRNGRSELVRLATSSRSRTRLVGDLPLAAVAGVVHHQRAGLDQLDRRLGRRRLQRVDAVGAVLQQIDLVDLDLRRQRRDGEFSSVCSVCS